MISKILRANVGCVKRYRVSQHMMKIVAVALAANHGRRMSAQDIADACLIAEWSAKQSLTEMIKQGLVLADPVDKAYKRHYQVNWAAWEART